MVKIGGIFKVPGVVKTNVEDIKKKEKESAMSIRSDDPLDYINFGELIDIFSANWKDFFWDSKKSKICSRSAISIE